MDIRPIETQYRGIRFRSRLEARWAVFFETLGLPWLYEPEGFELPSRKYLPDFFMPRQKIWIEIKPAVFEESTQHLTELSEGTGQLVWLARGGIPHFPRGKSMPENELGMEWPLMFFADGTEDGYHYWCRCPGCGEYGIQFDGRSERMPCCPKRDLEINTADEETIVDAFKHARTRRFEYDENDQWN